MSRATAVALILLAALTAGCTVSWVGYRYDEPCEAQLATDGIELLEIHAAAGYLRVGGDEGATEVRVDGLARASYEEDLERIDLRLERRGDRLVLEAVVPDVTSGQAALDLDVRVPAGLAVQVEDGSGSIACRHVGALEIRDGSGSIDVEQVAGGVSIHDGSGSIDVRHVSGDVVIHDGSGSLEVEHVEGDVRIDEDGSGSITISHVDGDVLVSDGSGGIVVEHVTGAFTVAHDGSGGIDWHDVAGPVSVPD